MRSNLRKCRFFKMPYMLKETCIKSILTYSINKNASKLEQWFSLIQKNSCHFFLNISTVQCIDQTFSPILYSTIWLSIYSWHITCFICLGLNEQSNDVWIISPHNTIACLHDHILLNWMAWFRYNICLI